MKGGTELQCKLLGYTVYTGDKPVCWEKIVYKDLHTRFYSSQKYIVREYKRNNIVYASAVCAKICFIISF